MQALVSVGELEKYVQRTFQDPAPAEQAAMLASGAVRTYCGWGLSKEVDVTFEVIGDGSNLLTLPTLHLLNVLRIAINDVYMDDPPARTPDLMWTQKGQIYRTQGWCRGDVITVHVDHGYDPLPEALKLVTLDLASRQMSNPDGWKSEQTSTVSRTFGSTDLAPLHKTLLDQYRLFD